MVGDYEDASSLNPREFVNLLRMIIRIAGQSVGLQTVQLEKIATTQTGA